jgi:GDP-4-dehydro-6-deoxy-D-mannose reductase
MRTLVTGVDGFVAPFLYSLLKEKGYQSFGSYFLDIPTQENYYRMDVTDKEDVSKKLLEIKPDIIFHLAGFSSVRLSFKNPELCNNVNVNGTKNILDVIVENNLKTKILVVSSAAIYGIPQVIPVDETHSLNPNSPYGNSRIEQEKICHEYYEKHKVPIIICRSFNHTGPGQPPEFVLADFAKQAVQIEKSKQDLISVGNIDVIRDFGDVRDFVEAYFILTTEGKWGQTYNICTGTGYSLRDLLKIIGENCSTEIIVKEDPKRFRETDTPKLIGNNTKICKDTNWKPKFTIEQTLSDMLKYWREN